MKATFYYVQRSGRFVDQNFNLVARCYSGNGPDLNNPDSQEKIAHGPIPRGVYRIGPRKNPPDFLGPIAMPLEPDPSNEMFRRSEFFIHGDNARMNHSASDGCIIMPLAGRTLVDNSTVDTLTVVAEDSEAEL